MVSVTTIMRSGYYIATLFPILLWIPVGTRLHLRRATKTFEHELLSSGLDPSAAHQLTTAFNHAHKNLIKQVISPRSWMQMRGSTEP
jgi:hypothetical protein